MRDRKLPFALCDGQFFVCNGGVFVGRVSLYRKILYLVQEKQGKARMIHQKFAGISLGKKTCDLVQAKMDFGLYQIFLFSV